MPAQYDAIKSAMVDKGVALPDAKTRASKIFIARGKGGSRSDRARELSADRKAPRKLPTADRSEKR